MSELRPQREMRTARLTFLGRAVAANEFTPKRHARSCPLGSMTRQAAA